MKYTALALLVCTLGFAHVASAQAPDSWIQVSSPGEYFRVQMPHQPKEDTLATLKTNYGDVEIKGKSYEASADGAHYKIWVLTRSNDPGTLRGGVDADLDACAEITWEGLLKPQRDRLADDHRATAAMSYVRGLAAKPLPGREYTLTLGTATGTTQCYSAGSRVYVLLALIPIGSAWQQEPFFQSFALAQDVPGQLPIVSAGPGTLVPHSDDITGETLFKSSEVTTRARVLSKPEPSYTESARKFSITGTVVLRCVFSKDGKIANLWVIRRLPHGLTERAISAARAIRFTPAIKDGQSVSMWMQLEYNFNLY